MKRFTLALALALASCSDTGPESQLRQLERNSERWNANRSANYDIDLTAWSAWFAPRTSRIEVRNGVAARVVDLQTGSEWPDPSHAQTIDSLFALARHQLSGDGPQGDRWLLTMDFHPQLGFLVKLVGDVPNWIDEEYGYSVSNFVRR